VAQRATAGGAPGRLPLMRPLRFASRRPAGHTGRRPFLDQRGNAAPGHAQPDPPHQPRCLGPTAAPAALVASRGSWSRALSRRVPGRATPRAPRLHLGRQHALRGGLARAPPLPRHPHLVSLLAGDPRPRGLPGRAVSPRRPGLSPRPPGWRRLELRAARRSCVPARSPTSREAARR